MNYIIEGYVKFSVNLDVEADSEAKAITKAYQLIKDNISSNSVVQKIEDFDLYVQEEE